MKNKKQTRRAVSVLVMAGMLLGLPAASSEAAVITSNATDKIAVAFDAGTAYSAGDYVTYDGEMYICTEESQGPWDTAESAFMQITKNQEIGTSGELSVSYSETKDPSEEKSLMAFAANAWQKLKLFFGADDKSEETDGAGYKNSSVSAKLNYLEKQNRDLDENLGGLRERVEESFRSVSSGKGKIAGAITDGGGSAGPQDSFNQLSQAITKLSKSQYDKGHAAGIAQGLNEVNKDSASYKQGVADGGIKKFTTKVRVNYDGPDNETGWSSVDDGNRREWRYSKSFLGHTIYAVRAAETSVSPYGGGSGEQMAVLDNGGCQVLSGNDDYHANGATIDVSTFWFTWNGFVFNKLYADTDNYTDIEITIYYI